jgi:O-antigen ligase
MNRKLRNSRAPAVPFWSLITFLILTFLTGGGSRGDIQSLIILRPAAVIFCGIGIASLRREHVAAHKFLAGLAVAIFALAIIHLIPLPPSIWGVLPGREIFRDIDKAAGLGAEWRPITLLPSGGWNALYSLFVPLAVLLLGVQLDQDEKFKLLPWVLGLGLFSGLLGLLQAIGDPQSSLYLYAVTNNGAAVGLFSNRNHQALLLSTLFPMLGVYASFGIRSEEQLRVRTWLAIAAGGVLVPLLLVTGSRGGLITGVLGVLAVAVLYRKPTLIVPKKRKIPKVDWRYPLIGFGLLCLGALTVLMSRAEALNRLTAPDSLEEDRFRLWPEVAKLVWKYFPVGSGAGSFDQAYQINEPNDLLSPTYFNHAHNDWLEVAMTYGLPGLLLLAVTLWAFSQTALKGLLRPFRQGAGVHFAQLGGVTILLIGISSIGDYPLRTPIMMCVMVIAGLWISGSETKRGGSAIETRLAIPEGE